VHINRKGGTMALSNREGIEEVFVVKSEKIDFFGALVKEKGGESAVNGRIKFPDGTRWYFSHPTGDRDNLVEKMVTLSDAIADFCSTNVARLKFERIIGHDEFIRLLRAGKGGIN
jgi:hypothetical protein